MRFIVIFLSIMFVVTVGCAVLIGRSAEPVGEVFEGTAQGMRGPITVKVRVNDGNITEIVVANSTEDRFVGAAAIEELIDTVIENNNTDVDVISGATISSRGFLDAVNNALLLAKE
jgi:uncharacterized protein with FMN-binding domain